MKSIQIIFFLILASWSFGQEETSINFEGHYQGKNIYIQNPFADNGNGFCVTEVFVNDSAYKGDISASAFEIDLKSLGLNVGDVVIIKVNHKGDCRPKMLNPEVGVRQRSTVKYTDIRIE